jgi:hypothetical protein
MKSGERILAQIAREAEFFAVQAAANKLLLDLGRPGGKPHFVTKEIVQLILQRHL